MIVFNYKSKKELKENIGQHLKYIETSMFGDEYLRDGQLTGANRPHITGIGREFFAQVTMQNGFINISRKRKTDLFENDQKLFLEILDKDIKKFIRDCKKDGMIPCIRLNGTSDIRYERLIDMESYDAIFYDYTKQPNRLDRKLPNPRFVS
mgnify:CR=1 FL=1